MKMKTECIRLYALLALLLSLSFSSCLTYRQVEVMGVKDVSVKQFSTKGFSVDVALRISNPNSFKIKLVKSDLDIYIRGKKAGKARIDNKIVLKRHSRDVHQIRISGDYSKVASALGSGLLNLFSGRPVPLQIKGKITAKALMIRKTFPVDVKHSVKL